MAQYLDKEVLVEKIEKRKKQNVLTNEGAFEEDVDILCLIDTLDVKEVDLEKEYKDFIKNDNGRSMFEIAKHFYELGLKAKGE
jgi:hypothetical protein